MRLQLTTAPTVDTTAASFELADRVAMTDALRDVALEVEAQNRLNALHGSGRALCGAVTFTAPGAEVSGRAFSEVATALGHQDQDDALDAIAAAWLEGRLEGITVGHAFGADGAWHERLWGVDSEGRVIEHSAPAVAYYGAALSEDEADAFAFSRPAAVSTIDS